MVVDVCMDQIGRMSIVMTRSIASGAVRPVMAEAASMARIGRIVTVPVQTSASGAVPPPMARAASTVRPVGMRSDLEIESVETFRRWQCHLRNVSTLSNRTRVNAL